MVEPLLGDLRRRAAQAVARSPGYPRQHRRGAIGIAAATASIALLAPLLLHTRPLLFWNPTASSPVGWYLLEPARPAVRGGMVVAWLPQSARRLAAERHYLPSNVPVVKRVFAVRGDRVCARGEAILVNGRPAARRRLSDPLGRLMPWWTGCRTLRAGELFLLSPGVLRAFDGRYFGVTRADQVVGRARLL